MSDSFTNIIHNLVSAETNGPCRAGRMTAFAARNQKISIHSKELTAWRQQKSVIR